MNDKEISQIALNMLDEAGYSKIESRFMLMFTKTTMSGIDILKSIESLIRAAQTDTDYKDIRPVEMALIAEATATADSFNNIAVAITELKAHMMLIHMLIEELHSKEHIADAKMRIIEKIGDDAISEIISKFDKH